MNRLAICFLAHAFVQFGIAQMVLATPYQYNGPAVDPILGPVVAWPEWIRGKELSFDVDRDATTGLPFSGQVNAWDGNSGLANGLVLQPLTPIVSPTGFQVDALANHVDTLTLEMMEDQAHLLFSVDDSAFTLGGTAVSVPVVGPIRTTGGLMIGGAGEITVERAGAYSPPRSIQLWASASEVSDMFTPADLDGLDLFGNEPGVAANAPTAGDSDKFSVDTDLSAPSATGAAFAVWDYNRLTGITSGYMTHAQMTAAVRSLLDVPGQPGPEDMAFNLDALMVYDALGSNSHLFEIGDLAIFSIEQITNAAGGYWATGSELFVLHGDGSVGFLSHGGHLWDKQFAEQYLQVELAGQIVQLDLNALEAVAAPEPASLVLIGIGLIGVGLCVRRRRS